MARACWTLPEAGTWTVTATRSGQTSDTKTVSVVDSYAVTLTFFSATITVTAPSGAVVTLKKGGSTVDSKTSTGTAVFTVYETGEYTVEATQGGQSTNGTVNVVSSTTSYAITLSFVSDTLNENSWDTISEVSDAGEGANYWATATKASHPQRHSGEPLPLEFLDLRFYYWVQSQLRARGFGPYPLPACKDGPLRRYGRMPHRRAVPQYWLLGGVPHEYEQHQLRRVGGLVHEE